jgi:hypothetical protein
MRGAFQPLPDIMDENQTKNIDAKVCAGVCCTNHLTCLNRGKISGGISEIGCPHLPLQPKLKRLNIDIV